jgi:DNA invertase Pin-like site-specific DNA recombinase
LTQRIAIAIILSMATFIAYARVSTDKQGRSGLGLEAQQTAINARITASDKLLLPIMVEVESGKRADRPVLAAALAKCRLHHATLLVAKLDRLSRNVVFLRTLIESGVDVAFCDLPHLPPGAMGRFMLTQMAAVAELEAGLTSERTRAALQAARQRGVKLGGYRGSPPPPPAASAAVRAAKADARAEQIMPTLNELREAGMSLHQMAAELTARGIATPRGGNWTATSVRRAMARA